MSNQPSIRVDCPACCRRVKVEYVQGIDPYTKCYCPECGEHFFLSGWELFRLKRKKRRLAKEHEKAQEALRRGRQAMARKQAAPNRLEDDARDKRSQEDPTHQRSRQSLEGTTANSREAPSDPGGIANSQAQKPSSVYPSNLLPCPDCGHMVSRNAATCPNCGLRFLDFGVEVWLSDEAHLKIPAPAVRQITQAYVAPDFGKKQLLGHNAEEGLWLLTLCHPERLKSKPGGAWQEAWEDARSEGPQVEWLAELTLGTTVSFEGKVSGGRAATIPTKCQGHVPVGKHRASLIEKDGYVALVFPRD